MQKITQIIEKSIKSLYILLKKAQAVVQKTPRQNVTSTVLVFSSLLSFFFFDGRHVWKNNNQLKRTALKYKNKKHMHIGKALEAH